EFLRSRSRRGDALLPALPELTDFQKALPAGTIYLAPTLVADELFLLAVRRKGPALVIRSPGSAIALAEELDGFRVCLVRQLARHRHGLLTGDSQRVDLDNRLHALGHGPLGIAFREALESESDAPQRVIWAPDDLLHGFPIHALRMGGRYLIEDFEFVWMFSG